VDTVSNELNELKNQNEQLKRIAKQSEDGKYLTFLFILFYFVFLSLALTKKEQELVSKLQQMEAYNQVCF
jgi:hypothetical protein